MHAWVNEGVEKALNPQFDLIKERLNLSDAKAENGILKKALRFTTQVGKTPLERIAPYRLPANISLFNIIILVILAYAYSSQLVKAEVAIAIYAVVLTLSLEVFRLRRK